MPRVINEQGDIKCLAKDGTVKWFSPYIVDQTDTLQKMGISVLDAPEKLEPLIIKDPEPSGIDSLTKKQIMEQLDAMPNKPEYKVTDSKEVLYNLYINQNK